MSSVLRVRNNERSMLTPDLQSPGDGPADLAGAPAVCPICGAMIETLRIGKRAGWTCVAGGYAHYYQAQYGHLERWFTSGEGNLREPVISAMNYAV
jgi:hypothetical protein